ncbi:putative hemolytic phospholipase C precursor [Mariannaea sp. PMI_226]|nr:putative hemolytic phospholipase C precursor [Mariannaea sp. PMI_226]
MSKYLALLVVAGLAEAASLKDVKHVVMLMQENRSFQHYFGTMAGVRGFADPNVQVNANGKSVWYQNVTGITDKTDWLLPYWLNYLGGDESHNKSQCLCAGSNQWIPTKQALNGGSNDMWAQVSGPQSWGYFKRQDIPYHFALAEAYTVGDAYHASITSNTDPNRWFWQSGTINVPGGKTPLGSGGVVLDDNQANGCEGDNLNCLPLKWPAFAQVIDEAGVDWRSYQQSWDWATNSGLFYFQAFQDAEKNSSLYERGLTFDGTSGLEAFKTAAAEGKLPEVSWVFPPGSLQEHPPQTPQDGSWFINQIVDAVIHGKNYKDTIFMLNYDEAGGWGDAVLPLVSPEGTPGEWFEDPYGELGLTYSGPGIRIPLVIVSPFTRGGHVFTERADHSSMLMFLEHFLEVKGYKNVKAEPLSDWRREHMSNLLNAFDFDNPDYSIPNLPKPETPIKNSDGEIIGMWNGFCSKTWSGACSGSSFVETIPFGEQTEKDALVFEDGFKGVRGAIAEGHYLVFESGRYALANPGSHSSKTMATKATPSHNTIQQRWVLEALEEEGTRFHIKSALDNRYLTEGFKLSSHKKDAEVYNIQYLGGSQYSLQGEDRKFLNIKSNGQLTRDKKPVGYKVFSVTYHK